MKIDLLRALEVLITIADTGSMTAAAQELKITQSAVSQQLKLLEADMNATLVARDTRPLSLTPAGRALRNHGGEILSHADQARAEVRELGASVLPHLRIALFASLANSLGPAIVRDVVRRKLPVKTVSIFRGIAIHHTRELPQRDVDIAITSNSFSDLEGLERHELINEPFVLLLPKNAAPPNMGLREIASKFPLIRYSTRTELGRRIEIYLRRQRVEIPPGDSLDAPEDLFAMVCLRQGWAISVPTHVLHVTAAKLELEVRQLPGTRFERTILLVARKGELGSLPGRIANVCRETARLEFTPRVHSLMPKLSDHFIVADHQPGLD
jgi:DNA-binding transcriptional LysR family regulator